MSLCVRCSEPLVLALNEAYLEMLKEGRQLVSVHTCERCGETNYVEHKRVGGETFGEDHPKARALIAGMGDR